MSKSKYKRKLTAILSADVVGYSRLMGDDEEFTIQTLNTYRDLMTTLIEDYSGSVVDAVGDNLLAEFTSVVDAVQCAVAIQTKLKKQNEKLAVSRHMLFRIGINIGDIIQEKGRIYGDGVNIAARIESLTEPGGICISRGTYDHIKKKLDFGYEYIGKHTVKNIADPVRVYKVLMDPKDAGKLISEKPTLLIKNWVWSTIVVAAIVFTLIGYQLYQKNTTPEFEPASIEKMVFPLPDKPSIAVLPFVNMSNDPNQEYFSDGITEHIITSLSKVPYLLVIARNSTFFYKNKSIKVQQISEELGVRYVLEGSVQRSDDRVRITVQLIDAIAGHHLWANSYDRTIDDIFALQDEIAIKIMAEMQVKLTIGELGGHSALKTTNIKAYEKFLMGYEYLWRRTKEDSAQGKILAQEAISLDPGYGAAYLLLARVYLDDIWFYQTKFKEKTLETVENLVDKSVSLSGQDATAHQILGSVHYLRRNYDKAITECQKALDLSPNSAEANYWYGHSLRYAGRFDEAIINYKKAIRLNPVTPPNYLNNLAWAYAHSEQHQEAISLWKKVIEQYPDYFFAFLGLAMVYQLSGNEIQAREAAAEVIRLNPKLTISKLRKGPATKNIDRERGLEALHKAGIPE